MISRTTETGVIRAEGLVQKSAMISAQNKCHSVSNLFVLLNQHVHFNEILDIPIVYTIGI